MSDWTNKYRKVTTDEKMGVFPRDRPHNWFSNTRCSVPKLQRKGKFDIIIF